LSNDYRGEALQSRQPEQVSDAASLLWRVFTSTLPSPSAPFGDVGRNSFRAPGFQQWDLPIDKNFRIQESARLQFRSEFFNIWKHADFGIPDSKITDAAFGTIRSTYPPRQIQFALKLLL